MAELLAWIARHLVDDPAAVVVESIERRFAERPRSRPRSGLGGLTGVLPPLGQPGK